MAEAFFIFWLAVKTFKTILGSFPFGTSELLVNKLGLLSKVGACLESGF